jgi:hypothetical protein
MSHPWKSYGVGVIGFSPTALLLHRGALMNAAVGVPGGRRMQRSSRPAPWRLRFVRSRMEPRGTRARFLAI